MGTVESRPTRGKHRVVKILEKYSTSTVGYLFFLDHFIPTLPNRYPKEVTNQQF